MAADRPLVERGVVEIKMGRSKFPGKPSKIGNRKRVNLSSCALPEDNDSSKAAKNIYLGLSVFNETFGDNEMVAPGPFHGFTASEIEDAMAEARLQQNEAEVEYKKEGMDVNFWDSFQNELFTIMSYLSHKTNVKKEHEINKTKLSFDGGGSSLATTLTDVIENQPSKTNGVLKRYKTLKAKMISNTLQKKVVRFHSPMLKLRCSSSFERNLQNQAAKKLLDKAKMSNLAENKNSIAEKKFTLPTHSIHSSRIIKPNKKFIEDNQNKRKTLRSRTIISASECKKSNVSCSLESSKATLSKSEPLKIDVGSDDNKKFSENKEFSKSNSQVLGTGKVILREARLQLDNNKSSLLEGPFSSSSASSLSPNSQLNVNPVQCAANARNIVCGVCGVVRFYRFIGVAKKFGIYCCDYCRKFISLIIKKYGVNKNLKFECTNGKGLCGILPIVKSQHFSVIKELKTERCEACWFKLCLKNFKMPSRLRNKLIKLLPVNMQMGVNLELSPLLSGDISNKFMMGNDSIKDFKWLKENSSGEIKPKENYIDKHSNWVNTSESVAINEKYTRYKQAVGTENKTKLSTQNERTKPETDDKNRQSVALKGPRVKHVCRSASVALGQPLATFPSEPSPNKKQGNESIDECKNCDSFTTNNCAESQGVEDKLNKENVANDGKQDKKPKEVSKPTAVQPTGTAKTKKKANIKAENPISMDFWESYDPDEICETGFGLIGSETFSVRALCFLCGSSGQERLIHCASCCEPYHEFCVNEGQLKLEDDSWKYDWVCPRCTICFTCGQTSGQQLRCVKCDNSYHTECVDRVGGRLLHSPDRPWVCSVCLRCKSCNGVDVSVFVGNLPLCKACFILRQKGNYCPLCQRCYEDDDYDSKMMECGQCKCWVHAKCEGLSDEKYQVLSFLPESVEYVCRMCCVMPPAPWWIAVEAELKSGYLGVLKALSKNRKVCTMLKWSPRKQCTCRQLNLVSRSLDFEEAKPSKAASEYNKIESFSKDETKSTEQGTAKEKNKEDRYRPGAVAERKTSIEVINHPTESLKLTLKIMKGSESEEKEKNETSEEANQVKCNSKESTLRVKKCPSNEERDEDFLANNFDCHEDSQPSVQTLFKGNDAGVPSSELSEKRTLSSPLNTPSDSGIGSTDDELKTNCLTDEENCRLDDQQSNTNREIDLKSRCDNTVFFLGEKHECFCFLEVDSYNSRSKPFSPNFMIIKKKVTTSEYSSLHQFHQDMQGMIAMTQSVELMELYHQTIKEIFPWFDPKFSRVQSNSQKVSGTMSTESTPVKSIPSKNAFMEECKVPKEKLSGQCLEYFYSDYVVEDNRMCLMCKALGDGPPGDTGRLLYCGQNEWVHCNCALWSAEVFEEIDGSLQNVHGAINRGRSIRCPECNLKGASIGCCARNCQETYHFRCARKVGCSFMDDKTVFCPAHIKDAMERLAQVEKEFEIRRPVYVELDKRKMKMVDSTQVRFAVGALQVNSLGRFSMDLSDQPEAIIPEQFNCTRLFWSCYEPWRIVRYHINIRLQELVEDEGVDCGINLTIDHSKDPELVELKLKQLKHFQEHNTFLDINEKLVEESIKEKRKLLDQKTENSGQNKPDLPKTPIKKPKKDHKIMKKIFDHFESKDDENLSDNQNTADLLPPDLEEAIFKDLPNDILDGISMQDIFMDIKNDPYESGTKEGIPDDPDGEDVTENSSNKPKKVECSSEDIWSEILDDGISNLKSARELKRSKSEVLTSQQFKKAATLKTYQKSCGLNWNCKTEGPNNNKWKKNSKCHVTVNLLEPQERGNMLQELKFTDGLVSVSTGAIDSVKDFKARLEENKRSIQQEEGKENKCLPWHTRLQPRLLQVDGGVDSSSSGSEAGESPQRLTDDGINSRIVALPQSSPYLDSPAYSIDSPMYPGPSRIDNYSPNFTNEDYNHSPNVVTNSLPQLDGVSDLNSDSSDSEETFFSAKKFLKRPRREITFKNEFLNYKIQQCDGGIDSESDDGEFSKLSEDWPIPLEAPHTEDEPVKCKKCHCTYRTKISYQRHLDVCCNDFMLSSSEGEMSEEESSPKKESSSEIKTEEKLTEEKFEEIPVKKKSESPPLEKRELHSLTPPSPEIIPEMIPEIEVKKVFMKSIKRTYARKKPTTTSKKPPIVANIQQVQQIVVQQPNPAPTLIVQNMPRPSIAPTTFIDSGPALGYVTAVNSQGPFGKPQLIATPNGIVSGSIQFPHAPEAQVLGGLCLNPPNMQQNLANFIIQQPPAPGTIISPHPGSVMMPSNQMMLRPTGLYDVIQDPGTGRVFLASRHQPVFYNMETVVSNTVMQTNQVVSNVFATSYSQTSTQIFQTREMEQVVNIPPNYFVVGPNPPTTEKVISSEDLFCVQAPQTLISNQTPIQISNQPFFAPTLPTPQPINTAPKIISTQLNPIRCVQVKQVCPPMVVNKVNNANNQVISQPAPQVFQPPEVNTTYQNPQAKVKPTNLNRVSSSNQFRSVPMMRPNVTKSPSRGLERAVGKPKASKLQPVLPRSRALVDYINNFKSDTCDNFSVKEPAIEKQVTKLQSSVDGACSKLNTEMVPVSCSDAFSDSVPSPAVLTTAPVTSYSDFNKAMADMSIETSSSPAESPTSEILCATSNSNSSEPTSMSCRTDELSVSFSSPKKRDLEVSLANENEDFDNLPKILSGVKSVSIDRELKLCLNMPELDDSSVMEVEEDWRPSPEISPKSDSQSSGTLPLQENQQSLNCSNSPQKVSPNKTPPSDEKPKSKRKTITADQNSPESTIYPTDIIKPTEDSVLKKVKTGRQKKKCEEKGPKLIFEITSDDGFKSSSTSMAELWANICDSVQEMRTTLKIPSLPVSRKGHEVLGMQNHGLQHCLEQLRGVEQCVKYKCKYFIREVIRKDDEESVPLFKENLSGCARTEEFTTRKEYDMFAWLASKHRRLPKLSESAEEAISSIRRANSLPMAMKYRNLKETAKLYLGVYRSKIHGKGLFCLKEIEAGEMVIEYAGEVIRSTLTDKREKFYTDKGIGCYMFRIDDHFVIDATMKGNAARFINHSCEPNCYSRVVDILGKKHIVIFALRRINVMEELTYDYKFPFEDEKISCHCLSKKCRKYLN